MSVENNSDIKLCQNMLIENMLDIFYVSRKCLRHKIMSKYADRKYVGCILCQQKICLNIKLCQNMLIENMSDTKYINRKCLKIC